MLEVNGKNKINSTWELTRASVDGLVQAIESGRNEVFSSYLETMARFHTYSARNVLLIAAQRPNATRVEGVRSWNELGRFVRPGEKGIFIFAPTVGVKTKGENKAEQGSKKPTKGKAAETTKEPERPEAQLLGFRGVYVFDVEQTGGSNCWTLASPLTWPRSWRNCWPLPNRSNSRLSIPTGLLPLKHSLIAARFAFSPAWNPPKRPRFYCAK
jgi:hypothetical protein